MLGTPEILLIVLVVLLLFGGKKIPELMHGMGKGVKSFKDGMNGKSDDSDKADTRRKKDNIDHYVGDDVDLDLND